MRAEGSDSPSETKEPAIAILPPNPRVLPSKPLVEAVLELKWQLRPNPGGPGPVDPGYPYAVGRLFEQLHATYPFREELPQAQIPDAITPYLVKHRFRTSEGGWPLVQIGPGIATLNFTETYTWELFRDAALALLPRLRTAYEGVYALTPASLLLRYINAVSCDFVHEDVIRFLDEKLHVSLRLPGAILDSPHREGTARGLDVRLALPVSRPVGVASVKFSTGRRGDVPSLIWEHNVLSKDEKAPDLGEGFATWLDQAHEVAEAWFLTLVEGDLLEGFQKEKEANA